MERISPPVLLKKYMSEETPPVKKAARKSVRKKSATKRAPRKSATSENSNSDEQLPLDEVQDTPEGEPKAAPGKKGREPRSGVRDARRETADEPIAEEISEKLVEPGSSPKEERKPKSGDRDQQKDQNRNDQGEGRGRGRGRNRGRERNEKREPKQRVPVDTKEMAKKAWKIFESEVTEEGLALLDESGLRDYARNSFNAARIFLEEEGRISGRQEKVKKDKPKEGSRDEQREKDQDDD